MKCLVCGGQFFSASYSSPCETCECEQQIDVRALREYGDEIDLPALKAAWQAQQSEAK